MHALRSRAQPIANGGERATCGAAQAVRRTSHRNSSALLAVDAGKLGGSCLLTSVMAGRMDRMILTTLRLPARLEAALTKHTVANLRVQRRAAPGAAPTVHDLVATQMDRSYATAHRVMREARHRLPSYTPRRVLDFGAGQSPMAWAAQASWPNVQLQVCALTLTPTLTLTVTLTLALTLAITQS